MTQKPETSNLVIHANRELDLAGFPPVTRAEIRAKGEINSDEDWDREIRKSVMKIIQSFAKDRHSGTSAGQVIGIVHQLLQFKPLSPLTNDPNEWQKIAEDMAGQNDLWQNRRNGAAFSHDGGKTFYIVDKYTRFGRWARKLPQSKLRSWVWSHRSWMHTIHTSQEANRVS